MSKQKFLTPTEEQFNALNSAYQYFNQTLFDGKLAGCILNFSRKKNTHGRLMILLKCYPEKRACNIGEG